MTSVIPNEDVDMVESITFTYEEELDDDQNNFEVICFPVDQARLIQPDDSFDSSDDETEAGDSSNDSDDEEVLLFSITPHIVASGEDDTIPRAPRMTALKAAPLNPRGKTIKHSADKMHRALVMKAGGFSYRQNAKIFNVPKSTLFDHKHRYTCRQGNAEPIKNKSPPRSKITADGSKFLVETVTSINTVTLQQLRYLYFQRFDTPLDCSTIYRHLVNKCRFTIKRAQVYPERRSSEDVKSKRVQYIEQYIDTGKVQYQKNCVFVDEAHVMANMRRNYAWAPVMTTPHVVVPQMYARSRSMLVAISHFGIVEVCLKINKPGQGGGTKAVDFRAFLDLVMDKLDERGLEDSGWNIVLDNAAIHTSKSLQNHVCERGYQLVYLPPYSPVVQPIELFFSKVKLLFRHVDPEKQTEPSIESQTNDLEERLAKAMSQVTLNDYVNWIKHCETFFERFRAREDDL